MQFDDMHDANHSIHIRNARIQIKPPIKLILSVSYISHTSLAFNSMFHFILSDNSTLIHVLSEVNEYIRKMILYHQQKLPISYHMIHMVHM